MNLSAEALEMVASVRESDGTLRPEAVVEAGRDPASPLHQYFTWHDATAANERRLEQARDVINASRQLWKVGPAMKVIPIYVPVPKKPGEYKPLADVVPRSDQARELVLIELGRVGPLLERARNIAEVLDLNEEVDAVIELLQQTRRKVELAEPPK